MAVAGAGSRVAAQLVELAVGVEDAPHLAVAAPGVVAQVVPGVEDRVVAPQVVVDRQTALEVVVRPAVDVEEAVVGVPVDRVQIPGRVGARHRGAQRPGVGGRVVDLHGGGGRAELVVVGSPAADDDQLAGDRVVVAVGAEHGDGRGRSGGPGVAGRVVDQVLVAVVLAADPVDATVRLVLDPGGLPAVGDRWGRSHRCVGLGDRVEAVDGAGGPAATGGEVDEAVAVVHRPTAVARTGDRRQRGPGARADVVLPGRVGGQQPGQDRGAPLERVEVAVVIGGGGHLGQRLSERRVGRPLGGRGTAPEQGDRGGGDGDRGEAAGKMAHRSSPISARWSSGVWRAYWCIAPYGLRQSEIYHDFFTSP